MSSTDITEDDRTTSLGTIRFAIEYFAAAIASHDVLEKQSPVGATAAPVYSLSGQAIELSLKAFLRQNGASLDDLRRLGHKLVISLDDAEKRGLIHAIDRGQLALLDKEYSAHRFRYIRTGYVQLLEVQHLFALVAAVMQPCIVAVPDAWRFMLHTAGAAVGRAKWLSPLEIKRLSQALHQ